MTTTIPTRADTTCGEQPDSNMMRWNKIGYRLCVFEGESLSMDIHLDVASD